MPDASSQVKQSCSGCCNRNGGCSASAAGVDTICGSRIKVTEMAHAFGEKSNEVFGSNSSVK